MQFLVHEGATLARGVDAVQWFTNQFAVNGWRAPWQIPLHEFHHYHLNTHKVLGVCDGAVQIQLGGPMGEIVELSAGDAIVVPAGLAHRNVAQSDDLMFVTAYPGGTAPDFHQGGGALAQGALKPMADPILGFGRGFAAS